MTMVLISSIIWFLFIVVIITSPEVMAKKRLKKIKIKAIELSEIIIKEYEKTYDNEIGEITLNKLNNKEYSLCFSCSDIFVRKLINQNEQYKLYHYLELILSKRGFSNFDIFNSYGLNSVQPEFNIKFKI